MAIASIYEVPGFPASRVPFDTWLANLPNWHAFKPMKVNQCILALFFQSLWNGTLIEGEYGVVEFKVNSPFDTAEGIIGVRVQGYGLEFFPLRSEKKPDLKVFQTKTYLFNETWVEEISQLQWELGISPAQAEREYRSSLFLQILQRQYLNNCLAISIE